MHDERMCTQQHIHLENLPLAMAYVPWQSWQETYDLNKGFKTGTIFPCLNKPFCETPLMRGGCR